MQLKEAIKNRRSIRMYKNESIKKEIIENILESAILAPSAKNKQPWRFVVVEDEEIKDKITSLMIKKSQELGKDYYYVEHTALVMKQAPIFIAVFSIYDDYNVYDIESIGACIEHICLSATENGLGSLWIGSTEVVKKEIASLLGKEDMTLVAGVSLGYPDQTPNPRPRLSLDEVVEYK